MPSWKRNLVVLCLAQLLTMVGFTSYFPSIPFLIQEMGVSSTAETASWLAAFWSGGSIAMMIASPIWGSLSDRWGRKVMLVRATAAGAILAFVMSLVQTPQQLIIVRVIQGIFCGTVAASITRWPRRRQTSTSVLAWAPCKPPSSWDRPSDRWWAE